MRTGYNDHYKRFLPDDGQYEIQSWAPYRVHERTCPTYNVGGVTLAGGKPAHDDNGDIIVLCADAPVGDHDLLGNWNALGLRATGSIDYAAKDVFIADDLVFPILTAQPQRLKEFFRLGVVGLAAIGHSGWAIGASRLMMDEIVA